MDVLGSGSRGAFGGTILSGMGAAVGSGVGGAAGAAVGATALPAAAYSARKAGERITRNRANLASELVRRGRPEETLTERAGQLAEILSRRK